MSLAHLQMTYAAAATGSAPNPHLLFGNHNPVFNPNNPSAPFQYHNQHQPYLGYPHYQQQSIPNPQYQHQRSTFAIQEILGLNSQNTQTAPSHNYHPLFSSISSLSPADTQNSSSSHNSSINNSLSSPTGSIALSSETNPNSLQSNDSSASLNESNQSFINRANEAAAAAAAAYGAYFSRTNFMNNFSNAAAAASIESKLNNVPTNTINNVSVNNSVSEHSDDENLNELDEDSYGEYL